MILVEKTADQKINENKKRWGFIYIYTISNKGYVGQAVDLKRRHKEHFRDKKTNSYFHNSLRKYWRPGCFKIIEAYYEQPKDLKNILNERELFWTDKLKTFDPKQKKGWNVIRGGGGCLGLKHTEEELQKMIKNHKGMKGYHHTEEWKRNHSEKMAGQNNPHFGKRGAEATWAFGKKNPSVSKMMKEKMQGEGNPQYGRTGSLSPNFGKSRSEETKEKIRETLKKHRDNKNTN